MRLNFKISEFNISGAPIEESIADKILHYHILPMQTVRNYFAKPIMVSQNSGYRSKEWELSKGRSGNSQHCFEGNGAVDWTCKNFKSNSHELLELILKYTKYTRMAIYKGFIHCDYNTTSSGKREIFTSTPNSKWTLKEIVNS